MILFGEDEKPKETVAEKPKEEKPAVDPNAKKAHSFLLKSLKNSRLLIRWDLVSLSKENSKKR